MSAMRISVRMLLMGMAFIALAGATATVASATPAAWTGPSRIVSTGAPLDWCPSASSICQDSHRYETLKGSTAVTMMCWIDSRTEPGFQYPRWFYVKAGSATGFVKAELVTNQNPSTPECTNTAKEPGVAASLWTTAPAQYAKTEPSAAIRGLADKLWNVDWTGGGTSNGWSGNCVIFADLAWYEAGVPLAKIGTGNASVLWKKYSLTHNDSPPIGALVFWGGSVGHVAVSIGNGAVVGTQGYSTLEPTTLQSISSITSTSGYPYEGWVAIP